MRVFRSSDKARSFCRHGSAITLGNYDGVHTGHRSILKALRKEADRRGLPAVVYTFEPHPVKLLAPHAAPPLINTFDQKIELLRDCDIDAVVFEKFDRTFARNSPKNFFEKYVMGNLQARFVMVGYDFTFGAKRQGNIETLEQFCFAHQIDVRIVDAFLKGNTLSSSSLTRKYVQEGRIRDANRVLGRPFFIEGKVVKGDGRGRKLEVPTANLQPINELLPKDGVYATVIEAGKKKYRGVTNVGTNPTFKKGREKRIETNLFGYRGSLYGKKIRLTFMDRIRDEKRFNKVEDLVKQIQKDIQKAKRIHQRSS